MERTPYKRGRAGVYLHIKSISRGVYPPPLYLPPWSYSRHPNFFSNFILHMESKTVDLRAEYSLHLHIKCPHSLYQEHIKREVGLTQCINESLDIKRLLYAVVFI